MTVFDVLVQTMAELTGEPEETMADFLRQWEKREPKQILCQVISPQEAETLRVAFREKAPGPITNLIQETVAAFRSWQRGTRNIH